VLIFEPWPEQLRIAASVEQGYARVAVLQV
jgi:hypothetical protein